MAPLILLIIALVVFYLVNRIFLNKRYSLSFQGRSAMAFMLVFTGIAHFTKVESMVAMLPEFIPYKQSVVYLTGIIELLAVVGLLIDKYSRLASILLIIFFVSVLPANIIGSMKQVELGGMEYGPEYLFFRIPLQLFFIGWTYYFGLKLNTIKT